MRRLNGEESIKAIIYKQLQTKFNNIIDPPASFVEFYRALVKLDND